MPLWKNTQHAFIAGQLDANVMGRQDMDRYFKGATLLKNFLVKRQGCISKRRGTDLTADLDGLLGTTYDGTPIVPDKMRLVPVTNGDDGRYLIFSHNLCFVADRRGVMTLDGGRARRIAEYAAEDVDENPIHLGGEDLRTSSPVEIVHVYGTGWYKVTPYSSLSDALSAAVSGDTIRLHHDVIITSQIQMTGAREITLDLYGYQLTVNGVRGGINVATAGGVLKVDSSRIGARVVVQGVSDQLAAFGTYSGSNSTTGGSIVLSGPITYELYAGGSNIVRAQRPTGVTVNGGIFTNFGNRNAFVKVSNGPLTVNGGTFTNDLNASGEYNWLIHSASSDVTVNGGTFTNLNSVYSSSFPEYSGYIIYSDGGCHVTVNGGRFTFAGPYHFVSTVNRRGGMYWNNAFLRIVRGEFSQSQIYDTYAHVDCGLADYTADGSVVNDAQPNADGFYGVKVSGEADYLYHGTDIGMEPYRIAVPYADDDLADLCIRQSGDTLFIAHRSYPPARIVFDRHGFASYEELVLDHTDFLPPVIDSAVMEGNDPKATELPRGFPIESSSYNGGQEGDGYYRRYDVSSAQRVGPYWYFTDTPTWLNNDQKYALIDFIFRCRNLGTVTDAGFSGNKADGSDSSCSYACTYTMTSVNIDKLNLKKTTTVSVMSFTKTITNEVTTQYTDGSATGSSTSSVTTTGTAENAASATSVIVPRTVRYVATYVKDGQESRPSVPAMLEYAMPWANNAVVNISLSKGSNVFEPDSYNIYKDNGNGYGLIGTMKAGSYIGGLTGSVETHKLFMPDNSAATGRLTCIADYETRRGWMPGSCLRKIISTNADTFSSSPANDFCLIATGSETSNSIDIDLGKGYRAPDDNIPIDILFDGRLYDRETDCTYLIISASKVTVTAYGSYDDGRPFVNSKTYSFTQPDEGQSGYIEYDDGTVETLHTLGYVRDLATDAKLCQIVQNGGMANYYVGVYPEWLVLQRRSFTAPDGRTVYGFLYGKGDCTELCNKLRRYIDFNMGLVRFDGDWEWVNIKRFKLTFSKDIYDDWNSNNVGCIRAIHFGGGSWGDFQDDYINPDMAVTPPDGSQDAHFSAAGDYPGCVGIYQQRLVFASTDTSPSTLWMSRVGDLYDFTPHESIREDDALELTLAATEFPNINHLVMGRDLMLFGDGGEWLISPVTGNALTYKTASAKIQSMIGSDRALQPLQLADETLFAERGGTCLRSINYNYTSDSYQSEDLSVIAQSVFRANPIVSMAYKQHPDSIVECVLADGRVATLVYMKEQEVAAWSVQELGGGWKAKEIVSPKCIVNGTTEMMLLVERSGVFQMWKVRDDDDAPVAESRVVLDALSIAGSDQDVEQGQVAVPLGDGRYAVGYLVESEFVSVRPEPEKGQTAQMEIKNATEAEIRVTDATTFSVKPYNASTGWREVALPAVQTGTAVALSSKDCKKIMTGSNNRDGRVHLKHADPWPITILSVSTTYQVEYENGGNGQQ